jgi:hypothetical protein
MDKDDLRISIPIPSVSLKQFIERAIRDDDFFARAIENPHGAMEECSVKLQKSAFTPDDFATFFGALAGVREVVQRKDKSKLAFEQIFGHPAQIRGAVISAQVSQGFCKEWDNRGAFAQRMQSFSSAQGFDRGSDICGVGPASSRLVAELDGVSATFEHQETNNHTRTEWSTQEFQQSNTRSERGTSKSFEGQGFLDLLNGPLMHPTDLAAVSARLETFADLVRGRKGTDKSS